MTIRDTNRFCKACGREMEFLPGVEHNHEFIGRYVCGCCGCQEHGSYCEMAFRPSEEVEIGRITLSELALCSDRAHLKA
jgi:hypothetical protein